MIWVQRSGIFTEAFLRGLGPDAPGAVRLTRPDRETALDFGLQSPLGRREFLRMGRDLALLALLPGQALAEWLAGASRPDGAGFFLNAAEMRTLRALCERFIPGPPEDPDPGAREAGAADYIDLLLGAFERKPVELFAGGPFSLREGGGHNHFADFIELDALEERTWRARIEGSRGRPELEWNGPVVGWQERYRRGLELLEAASRRLGAASFSELSAFKARWLLRLATGELDDFLDLAFGHTLEGMYGPPEYGGNRGLVGWSYTRWPGDHQPHYYAPEAVSEPDADEAEAVARAVKNAEDYLGRKLRAMRPRPEQA